MTPAYRPPSAEEKEAYVRSLFDQIAQRYDAMNQVMSAGQWERWHREFVRHTGLQPGQSCLDVACGTGDLSMLAAAQVSPGGKVVGIDFSEGMLEVGRRRVAASPFAAMITLQWGNAMKIDFANGSFDGVTMGWAMRNVSSIPKTLSEIYRVLKPGGRFVCLEAAKPVNPALRLAFLLYFKSFLPLIDWLVVRTGRAAKVRPYTYLSRSLDSYPYPAELEQLFREAGFTQTGYRLMMMGTVAIHYGTR